MPIYEYKCNKCGQIKELWQKLSDPPLDKCGVCGGRVNKIISHNTFHLKGTGWYVTDYSAKSPGNKPAKKEENKKPDKDDSTTSVPEKVPGKET